MRRAVVAVALFVLLVSLAVGREPTSSDRRLLQRADAIWSYEDSDFSAQYTITQHVPGEGSTETVAAVFRRDAADIYTIIVLEPERERGQGYLKQGETLWFFDPDSGRFNSTSSRSRFQNTNARNSDFTRSTLSRDYQILSVEPDTLGRFDALLFELSSEEAGVTYPYMKLWLDESGRILKTEDYSLSRRHLRTTAIPSYNTVDGRPVPSQIYIFDHLEGAVINGSFQEERTIVDIARVTFEPVPDGVFSKAFLENTAR